MTIRKQFKLLISFLILIPLIFVLYICIQDYIRSPRRMIIREYKNPHSFINETFSQEEIEATNKIILDMPSDLEFVIFTNKLQIIYSKFPEFESNQYYQQKDFYKLFNDSSTKYIYQVSKRDLRTRTLYIVSRIDYKSRNQSNLKRNKILPTYMVIILTSIVTLCMLIIIIISRSIYKSVILIEKQTSALAEGDLSTQIINKDNKINQNEITSISLGLEKMRQSLLDVQNKKNKFIMGISHDLRTPVSIIKGYTEALKDKVITDEKEINTTYDLILAKSGQLESMIDTLLNFMKLNSKELREKLTLNSISKTIIDFAKDAQITAQVFKRHMNIDLQLPEEEIFIPMDNQLSVRVFENLFSNALRYTNDNDQIDIRSYVDKENLYFVIKDNGIGIAPEDLNNIFDLFYRGTNSRLEGGMGIGLSVVKNIVDIHGWHIGVVSELNKGTCFTITIPLYHEE